MLVSVVIGALNEEKYLGKALESLARQRTIHRTELIVGDGYSEDSTAKIAESFGAKVVKERNRSAAWERQAGAGAAKGEVIAFTDADALVPDDWVEKIAGAFAADDKLLMLYGPVYFSDSTSLDKAVSRVAMGSFLCCCSLVGLHNPIGSNLAVRRSAFQGVKGFDTGLVTAEDLDLAKRMAKKGKVKYFPGLCIEVSSRRVKKWGYVHFAVFHLLNALRFHLTGNAERDYEPVR